MPLCKNDPKRKYKGDEPSPKGLGWCAHGEKEGKVRKGLDGNKWVVKKVSSGSLRWVKDSVKKITKKSIKKSTKKITLQKEHRIIVRYAALTNNIFPNYKMIQFPKTWKYNGDEGALTSQPKWQTNNAYFYGPKIDMKKAKESIIKLYDKYKKNKYISKYIISIN